MVKVKRPDGIVFDVTHKAWTVIYSRLTGYKRIERDAPSPPAANKPVDRMNKAELQAKAAELGLTCDDELTKAQIHDAIDAELARRAKEAAQGAPETPPTEPLTSPAQP